jgi:hypothetical protein
MAIGIGRDTEVLAVVYWMEFNIGDGDGYNRWRIRTTSQEHARERQHHTHRVTSNQIPRLAPRGKLAIQAKPLTQLANTTHCIPSQRPKLILLDGPSHAQQMRDEVHDYNYYFCASCISRTRSWD